MEEEGLMNDSVAVLRALMGARLMLYAWKVARANLRLPDNHDELNATIAEVEDAIRKIRKIKQNEGDEE